MIEGDPEHSRTIDTALAQARSQGLPRPEALALMTAACGLRREQLLTQGEAPLAPAAWSRFQTDCARRLAGEPLAYVLGEREFFGVRLRVGPEVLIPRPDTELLVEFALAHCADRARVIDMGTGSGAIAVALAHARADLDVWACDISTAALAVAAANGERWAPGRIRFVASAWFDGLASQRWDVIVSNPPYIAAGDPHLQQGDLRFEPAQALTDGADGLSHLRHLIAHAPLHLTAGGWLALEHGYDQAAAVRALLTAQGFDDVHSQRDLAGIERISVGRWRAD